MIDPSDLTEIWDEHADRLLLIARSIGGPAEDAVQEAFVRLAAQSTLPDDTLAWLVQVTRNQLLQWQRGRRRRRKRESRYGGSNWFEFPILNLDQKLDAREVTATLMSMSSPRREIIVMHLWGEMTFESIAEVLGLSRATAHREFVRGLESLRDRFVGRGQPDSIKVCNE